MTFKNWRGGASLGAAFSRTLAKSGARVIVADIRGNMAEERLFKDVQTISLADACDELGEVPKYVKMDIEGAEVATIQGSQRFLSDHPIHFAIESYHRINGELTFKPLERLFRGIGYEVRSSNAFGQMFTWADPRS